MQKSASIVVPARRPAPTVRSARADHFNVPSVRPALLMLGQTFSIIKTAVYLRFFC
jgi:hypothetical protein